jgi:hypothetical protein
MAIQKKGNVKSLITEPLRFRQTLLGVQSQLLHDMAASGLKRLENIVLDRFEREEIQNHSSRLSEDELEIKVSDLNPGHDRHGPTSSQARSSPLRGE